jgi:hypothetical protein
MINQASQFFAILTNVGVAKQANADALGVPWKISEMAVGDANDTDPIPGAEQTALINERRRAPLNQLYVDPANSAIIVAEQVIPAEIGGWWIREIGLFDADGDLVAIANCAPSFKPLLAQGSGRTQVVRLNMQVSNSSSVELKIDPSVVLATRKYVDDSIINVLPANKRAGTYTRVTVNNRGVVMAGANPSTLADNGIKDAYTKAQVDALIAQASALPVGATVSFPRGAVPPGFLELNGSTFDAEVYPDLFAYLGSNVLPDYRGEFPRGWDHGRGVDAGRELGSWQVDAYRVHRHSKLNIDATGVGYALSAGNTSGGTTGGLYGAVGTGQDAGYPGLSTGLAGGPETRPRNIAVMWCIKGWNAPINQGEIDIAALASQVRLLAVNGPVTGAVRNGRMVVDVAAVSAEYTADEIVVSSSMDGRGYRLASFKRLINLRAAGIGGMDKGAAPLRGFVALYAIYNPSTNASGLLASDCTSTAAPEVYGGASMPEGYTASALVAVVPTTSTGQIGVLVLTDRRISITNTVAVSTNSILTAAPLSISGIVPRNAKSVSGSLQFASTATANLSISISASSTGQGYLQSYNTLNPTVIQVVSFQDVALATSQTLWISTAASGGTPSFGVRLSAYTF